MPLAEHSAYNPMQRTQLSCTFECMQTLASTFSQHRFDHVAHVRMSYTINAPKNDHDLTEQVNICHAYY